MHYYSTQNQLETMLKPLLQIFHLKFNIKRFKQNKNNKTTWNEFIKLKLSNNYHTCIVCQVRQNTSGNRFGLIKANWMCGRLPLVSTKISEFDEIKDGLSRNVGAHIFTPVTIQSNRSESLTIEPGKCSSETNKNIIFMHFYSTTKSTWYTSFKNNDREQQ